MGGVIGGLAAYIGMDPLWLRISTIVSSCSAAERPSYYTSCSGSWCPRRNRLPTACAWAASQLPWTIQARFRGRRQEGGRRCE
ncbi:MAG: PspC domain-containing protein [Flavobacteriales bacterium]|nr:PspC domain-containing protein [Flavobacteriales bacterium]